MYTKAAGVLFAAAAVALAAGLATRPTAAAGPTFSKDVAPILYKK